MNYSNQVNSKILSTIASVLVFGTTMFAPGPAAADTWELRTVDLEVPGTREIENGEIDKGLEISHIWATRVSGRREVAVMTNLCIGYIVKQDFSKAEEFCRQAAEHELEKTVTHNNRGVLRALQSKFEQAEADFQMAADTDCAESCADDATGSFPDHVARRNLVAVRDQSNAEAAEKVAATRDY